MSGTWTPGSRTSRLLRWAVSLALSGASFSGLVQAQATAPARDSRATTFVLTQPLLFKPAAKRAERVRIACHVHAEPCSLSLHAAWRLPAPAARAASAERVTAPQTRPARSAAARAVAPVPRGSAPGVGKRIQLKAGRELSLQLTPTPARCAPLLQLRY